MTCSTSETYDFLLFNYLNFLKLKNFIPSDDIRSLREILAVIHPTFGWEINLEFLDLAVQLVRYTKVPEQFSTLAFLLLFEGQKVTFFPLSRGKNINEIRLSRELGK